MEIDLDPPYITEKEQDLVDALAAAKAGRVVIRQGKLVVDVDNPEQVPKAIALIKQIGVDIELLIF